MHTAGAAGAPAIVLGHSILASTRMWRGQVEMLLQLGLRVVSIDTRGHGASDEPPPQCILDDLVSDSIRVLDELEIKRAHFMGVSLGGMVALGLGILHPDRVSSLIVCDARADAPPAFAAPWDDRIAAAQKDGAAALADSTAERWFGQDFLGREPVIAREVKEMIAATSVGGFIACARALQGLDYLGRVGRITAPTQWVVGANDGPLPDAMRHLQSLVPGSALEVIEGAGHLPNIDQPAAFNAVVARRLRALTS
ncbi:MAG TPA: alpha/beta fold hydrolase [Burkholderiaceae bacterium]|nr:alpha/beta fold hydrolase [Burkholderiaceae bacterium]